MTAARDAGLTVALVDHDALSRPGTTAELGRRGRPGPCVRRRPLARVELGDGQVSDRPAGLEPGVLLAALV